ncbi:hypothetical protein CaCOL14_009700 [Colletotrichum acutatum]
MVSSSGVTQIPRPAMPLPAQLARIPLKKFSFAKRVNARCCSMHSASALLRWPFSCLLSILSSEVSNAHQSRGNQRGTWVGQTCSRRWFCCDYPRNLTATASVCHLPSMLSAGVPTYTWQCACTRHTRVLSP